MLMKMRSCHHNSESHSTNFVWVSSCSVTCQCQRRGCRIVITRLGTKWAISLCMLGYVVYMAANIQPMLWLNVFAGILLGIMAGPMWTAKCSYLTQLGTRYAKISRMSKDVVINTFFGFFFLMFQSCE